MTTINDVITELERTAPPAYQENYDNSGLLTGNRSEKVTGIIICLDSTEEVIEEAISAGCNLVIAHHPLIFSGLKSLTGKNYIERAIIKAIKNDIAIYAIHTNLDNVIGGVNGMLASKLRLQHLKVLLPKKGLLKKLVTFCPVTHAAEVRRSLFSAGAGHIGNYSECSFNVLGSGTFKGNDQSQPFVGEKGIQHTEKEERIEVIFEALKQSEVLKSLHESHPYEEVAFDIYPMDNSFENVGSGMIGELQSEVDENTFLLHVKKSLNAEGVRYTPLTGKKIKKVAICGGSGFFLLDKALQEKADAYVTSDVKYHQFFDADKRILLVDAGHYETEQFTMEILEGLLNKKFATFAIRLTKVATNPVNYL